MFAKVSTCLILFLFIFNFTIDFAQVNPVLPNSISLSGSNHISISDNNVLDLNSNTTIEGWFNFCESGTIFSKNFCANEAGYYLLVEPTGQIRFRGINGSTCSGTLFMENTTTNSYVFNEWHHFALTIAISGASTDVKLYMDHVATPVLSLNSNWFIFNNNEPFRIGAYRGISGNLGLLPKGRIQDFRVYNSIIPFNDQCLATPNITPNIRLTMQNGTANSVTNSGSTSSVINALNLNTSFSAVNPTYLPSSLILSNLNLTQLTNTGCQNSVDLSTIPAALIYSWNVLTPGNTIWTNISTGANNSENYSGSVNGTYFFSVIGTIGSCTKGDTISITLNNQVSITPTSQNESCQNNCDGTAAIAISNGTLPYTITWSNGSSNTNLTNLCAGTYTVQVTDNNGCTVNSSVIINPGQNSPDATIQTSGPIDINSSPIQFTANSGGGVWSSDCGACMTSQGVFDPATAGIGTYQICYSVGSGLCSDQDCQTIEVTGCLADSTYETHQICSGDSILIQGQYFANQGIYPFTLTNQNGCDSIHYVDLNLYPAQPPFQSLLHYCIGDTIQIDGNLYTQNDAIVADTIDFNGCPTTFVQTLIFEACGLDEFEVYIPNVFTPNGDNINEFFFISIIGGYLNDGYIFNRWGNMIKEFSSTDLQWDGTNEKGQLVPDGVYTYVVNVEKNGGGRYLYHGFVTVLK